MLSTRQAKRTTRHLHNILCCARILTCIGCVEIVLVDVGRDVCSRDTHSDTWTRFRIDMALCAEACLLKLGRERRQTDAAKNLLTLAHTLYSVTPPHMPLLPGTPSSSCWAFKSVFGLSKSATSAVKRKADCSASSSPAQESRRLSASFLGSAMKGGTPLTLHGTVV